MLHIKDHGKRSTGSGEDDFLKGFNHYESSDHLGHVTSIILIDFHFLLPKSLHTKFGKMA